jgi:hypothetical protein
MMISQMLMIDRVFNIFQVYQFFTIYRRNFFLKFEKKIMNILCNTLWN